MPSRLWMLCKCPQLFSHYELGHREIEDELASLQKSHTLQGSTLGCSDWLLGVRMRSGWPLMTEWLARCWKSFTSFSHPFRRAKDLPCWEWRQDVLVYIEIEIKSKLEKRKWWNSHKLKARSVWSQNHCSALDNQWAPSKQASATENEFLEESIIT